MVWIFIKYRCQISHWTLLLRDSKASAFEFGRAIFKHSAKKPYETFSMHTSYKLQIAQRMSHATKCNISFDQDEIFHLTFCINHYIVKSYMQTHQNRFHIVYHLF